jgi:hypothetical protein
MPKNIPRTQILLLLYETHINKDMNEETGVADFYSRVARFEFQLGHWLSQVCS